MLQEGINEVMYVQCFTQFLTQRKPAINVGYYYKIRELSLQEKGAYTALREAWAEQGLDSRPLPPVQYSLKVPHPEAIILYFDR